MYMYWAANWACYGPGYEMGLVLAAINVQSIFQAEGIESNNPDLSSSSSFVKDSYLFLFLLTFSEILVTPSLNSL